MQAAGYSYNWYRNTLCLDEIAKGKERGENPYKLIDSAATASPPGAGGLLYLPYLLGERSPRWNHDARGAFVGLSVSTGKGDISRAVLEGVGFNLKIILDILERGAAAGGISEVVMIGGGAKGAAWLQILADIWQKPLAVPAYTEEATSLGAAVCGGVGIGAFRDFSVIREFNAPAERIEPNRDLAPVYGELFPLFNKAYEGLLETFRGLAEFRRR
jgi:xylulokinase